MGTILILVWDVLHDPKLSSQVMGTVLMFVPELLHDPVLGSLVMGTKLIFSGNYCIRLLVFVFNYV